MPYSVDDFKRALGHGARTNLFKIEIKFPFGGDATAFSIMCEKVSLTGSRDFSAIDVPYQGDTIRLAGGKAVEKELAVSFKNSQDFKLRNAFELWMETIQNDFTSFRATPELYKTGYPGGLKVHQLNNLLVPIRTIEIIGAWPMTMNQMEMGFDKGDITTTDISFAIDGHLLTTPLTLTTT